jgi:hypothetical protein
MALGVLRDLFKHTLHRGLDPPAKIRTASLESMITHGISQRRGRVSALGACAPNRASHQAFKRAKEIALASLILLIVHRRIAEIAEGDEMGMGRSG